MLQPMAVRAEYVISGAKTLANTLRTDFADWCPMHLPRYPRGILFSHCLKGGYSRRAGI